VTLRAELEALEKRIAARDREIERTIARIEALLDSRSQLEAQIKSLQEEVLVLDRAGAVLNSLGEDRQFKAQTVIESLVTRGLQEIFDDTLSFHILQTVKGKNVAVEFLVRTTLSNGVVVDTPVMDARGGGLAATIGFLLRVVILLLKNGKDKDNILILDETFAHVSDEYLEGLGAFLREIVEKTGIQIIMVTHQPQFLEYADKAYRFNLIDGRTVVEEDA
jgi:DNA repair exonuclease SbcCD ATPase subunit